MGNAADDERRLTEVETKMFNASKIRDPSQHDAVFDPELVDIGWKTA